MTVIFIVLKWLLSKKPVFLQKKAKNSKNKSENEFILFNGAAFAVWL